MITSDDVLSQALQLPEKERASVAHQLLLSLEPEEFADDEIAGAWQQEIESRLAKIATGNFHARPWREAVAEVRQELKKDAKP